MTDKPLVFAAMPTYGGTVHPGAAKAFWLQAADDSIDFMNVDHGSSLLANAFNGLWCAALNMRRDMPDEFKGRAITHFAMLHSDIAPACGWLKTLVDELDRCDADLCSVVVPIKSGDGITSTAISSDDPFRVERRLTIKEVGKLPETFDAEACGYPGRTLLANTGCWVCRFDRPWVEKVLFEIRDRIDFEDGKFVPKVLPEDWNFSRQVFDHGGKVICTRKVPVRHYGATAYTMERTTGNDLDHMAEGKPLPCFAV